MITKDTKLVKCVDNINFEDELTVNKIYNVKSHSNISDGIWISNDTDEKTFYLYKRFIPADEPTESNMHDFKVGDKVEVLSDAFLYPEEKNCESTVTDFYDLQSAVGNIGEVEHIYVDDRVVVSDLPLECLPGNRVTYIYRPEQLRKVENASIVEETQPITKDNIVEVLEYNGIDKDLYLVNRANIHCYAIDNEFTYVTVIYFDNPLWLQLVEVHFGKLKPLPVKPKFDFVQHLLDNGAIKRDSNHLYFGDNWDDCILYINRCGEKWQLCAGKYIEPTPENAKLIVEMSKLSKGLK